MSKDYASIVRIGKIERVFSCMTKLQAAIDALPAMSKEGIDQSRLEEVFAQETYSLSNEYEELDAKLAREKFHE